MSPSKPQQRVRWTIAELSERVTAALEATGYRPPANGQVRAVPDLRTIRYYTSLGLLDRPLEMRGRTALYGPRHLRQLCAIKRLQAEGRALGEVQAALAGLDDRALARLARVPAELLAGEAEAAAGEPEPARRAAAFWSQAPAPVTAGTAPAAAPPPARPLRVAQVTRIRLARGVELEIAPEAGAFDRTPGSQEAAALARAAAPLLAELRRQGLVAEVHQEE